MAVNVSAQMQRSAASPAIQASRVDWGVQMMWLDARGGVHTFKTGR